MVGVLSSFTPPSEGILLQVPSTKFLVDNEEIGTATLYIRESDVIWGGGYKPSGDAAPNITIMYTNISMHAVQTDPSPSFFMLVNYDMKEILNLQTDDEELEDDEIPVTQLRFIPERLEDLQSMFAAMSQGQALNPDPADEVEEDQFFMGEEDNDDDEQFADAEVHDDDSRLVQQAMHLSIDNNPQGNGCEEDVQDNE